MPFDPVRARRWINDILYHIDLADNFVFGLAYDSFCLTES
jgi:hypothetical protein